MSEIIFEVRENELEGGFVATALGRAIATHGETLEEIREMVRDAVRCHFGDGEPGLPGRCEFDREEEENHLSRSVISRTFSGQFRFT